MRAPRGVPTPWEPSADMLPGFPHLTVELATNHVIAARLYGFRVWPQFFQFTLFMLTKPNLAAADTQIYENPVFAPAHLRGDEFAGDRIFELQVRFGDGTQGSSIDFASAAPADHSKIRVILAGGGSVNGQLNYDFIVWPLPPPGPVTFRYSWGYYDMPAGEASVDAAAITAAIPLPLTWT